MSRTGEANLARKFKRSAGLVPKARGASGSKCLGDVPMCRLRSDIERGVEHFWKKRGGSPF